LATVNSILGPLGTSDLGFTLMHEHIMVGAAGVYRDYPELLGPNAMGRVITRLKAAKEDGIDTLVDATTLDLGRDVELLAEASRRTGVQIIACTGWWLDVPRFFAGVSPDQLARVFVREIEKGIGGTDIKAGILKSASDFAGVTPEEEVVLRAVARAHLETGVPIMLHSYSPGQVGRQQLSIVREEGVDLGRVKMDHSNDTTDVEYLTWLLDQGCYLGLDRYPGRTASSRARTRTMKALIDAGFADRLCPSHDGIVLSVVGGGDFEHAEAERLEYNPHGFLYLNKVVLPELREMGVPEETLESLFVDVPRRFFEGR
jgi:phosphotriesterase-related protein